MWWKDCEAFIFLKTSCADMLLESPDLSCSSVLHSPAPHPHRSGGCCCPHLFPARRGEWRHRPGIRRLLPCLFIFFSSTQKELSRHRHVLPLCLRWRLQSLRTGFSSMFWVAWVCSGYQNNEGEKSARGGNDLELYKHTAPWCKHGVITLIHTVQVFITKLRANYFPHFHS